MKVGLFTALFAKLGLDEVIKKIKPLGIRTVELGTGNYPGDPHIKLDWLNQSVKLKEFKQKLDDQGISISALSCHGNVVHPNKEFAQNSAETNRKTILLAEKLGVKNVIDFSGCPGDSDNAKYPSWSPTPWPPDYLDLLKWQWERKVIPFWIKRAKFAQDHGVRICGCAPRRGRRSAAISIPATCSGRASIRPVPCAHWVTQCSTATPRTRRCTTPIIW